MKFLHGAEGTYRGDFFCDIMMIERVSGAEVCWVEPFFVEAGEVMGASDE